MAQLNAIDEARSLYEKLRGGVSQVAGRVGSFVQKNPLPVAYANQQFQQRVAQPITQSFKPVVNRVASTPVVPFIPQVSPKSYLQGQVINPIRQGVQQMGQGNFVNRALGAGQVAGGAFSATPGGALWNVGTGFIAGTGQAIRERVNPQSTIAKAINNPTSFASTGLGVQNPALALGIDIVSPGAAGKLKAVAKVKGMVGSSYPLKVSEAKLANSLNYYTDLAVKFKTGISGSDRIKAIKEVINEAIYHKKLLGLTAQNIRQIGLTDPERLVGILQNKATMYAADQAAASSLGRMTMGIKGKKDVTKGRLGDVKKGVVQPGNSYADLHGVNPESEITVYRGVKASQNGKLTGGEWVTQDKELARLYSRNRARAAGEDAKIISQKVKAKDLIIDESTNPGVDNEFRYKSSLPPSTGGEIGGTPLEIEQSINRNVQKIQQDFLSGKITMEQRKALAQKEFARSSGEIGGVRPLNTQNQTKFVPTKTEKNLGIEGQARGVALSAKTPTIEPQASTANIPGKSTIPTQQEIVSQPEPLVGKAAIDSTTGSLQKTPQTLGVSISQETNSYLSELSKRQNDARKAGTKVGTIKRLYNDLKTKFVDSTAPIEDVLTEAEKKGKFTVLPKNDVRLQIDRVLRSPSIAGQFAKDNGLTQVIKDAPDLNALDQYMIAKHAKTIEATGRKTGRDLAKDEQLVNELGATYEPFAQQVTAYSRKLLDYSVDTGLIGKDLAEKLKSAYPDYVPLNRIMEEVERTGPVGRRGVASLSSQSVVKKLVGSEREIDSPIATLVAKTEDAFAQGERNVAARQLASYKDLPGFKGLITELSGNTTGKHTFSFIDNGVKRTFETTPEIESAAKSLNRQQLGFIGNILSVPTRILRLGATGVNVPFVAANIVKDQLTGFVNSSTVAKTSLLNPGNFLRALWSAGKHDELYDELVRAGAGGTSFDIGRMQPKLAVEKIRSGRNIASKIGYTVRHPGELITALEDLIGKSEELGRLQQFRGTKQALTGRTVQDQTLLSAKAARENTANFARAGDWGRVLNVIIPYFNAGIQGARATVTALQKRPAQTSAKIAIGLFTPVAAATMWNLSDPERKKVYEDIDDFEKENNIILVLDPNKGMDKGRYSGVIKIPIQQGFGGLSTGVRQGIEQAYGVAPAKMGEIAAGLIQFGTSLNVGSGREFLSSITPQALKVPIETTTNTNLFTGKQIVPQYMKSKPADEQVYDFTSGTARIIGKGLNTSPLTVQNAVTTSMGGVGRQVLNASDTVLNKLGVIPNSQVGGESVGDATTKRFFSASGGKQLDEAYALKDKKDNAKRQAVQAFVSGDSEGALKIMKENKIQLDKSDIKTFKTNQTKKAADLFIENKQDGAVEIMKKYKLQLSQSDVNKAAKRKAVELYKLGLKDEALVIMKKYKIQLTKKDIE